MIEQKEVIKMDMYQKRKIRAEKKKDDSPKSFPSVGINWYTRIDKFLLADDRDILKDAEKISHEIACDKALTEFEKYRIKQDKLYKSDFDLLIEETNK